MPAPEVPQVREAIALDKSRLDAEVGPLAEHHEDPNSIRREQHAETVALIDDFADGVEEHTADIVQEQGDFVGWMA